MFPKSTINMGVLKLVSLTVVKYLKTVISSLNFSYIDRWLDNNNLSTISGGEFGNMPILQEL